MGPYTGRIGLWKSWDIRRNSPTSRGTLANPFASESFTVRDMSFSYMLLASQMQILEMGRRQK